MKKLRCLKDSVIKNRKEEKCEEGKFKERERERNYFDFQAAFQNRKRVKYSYLSSYMKP